MNEIFFAEESERFFPDAEDYNKTQNLLRAIAENWGGGCPLIRMETSTENGTELLGSHASGGCDRRKCARPQQWELM